MVKSRPDFDGSGLASRLTRAFFRFGGLLRWPLGVSGWAKCSAPVDWVTVSHLRLWNLDGVFVAYCAGGRVGEGVDLTGLMFSLLLDALSVL